MGLAHALAHLRDQGQNDQCGDCMADEGRNNEDQARKYHQYAVQTHPVHFLRNGASNGMQKARARDGFAERETTSGENDDGPEEIVEVFFGEYAGAEEEDDWDDGDDAHVAEYTLKLMRYAPKHNRNDSNAADEPLHAGELIPHRAYWHDRSTFAGLKGDKE